MARAKTHPGLRASDGTVAHRNGRGGPPKAAARTVTPSPDLTAVVGANVRRARALRGLSLARLAEVSGVSRAMLSQVELGRSAPTISTLSRVALALDVPFSVLLCDARQRESVVIRAGSTSALTSHDATFMSRPLFPPEEARPVEFYEVRLAPDAVKKAPAQAPETTENLVVASGALVLTVRGERHHLGPGDAILFHADAPYEYRNGGLDEVCAYVVVALQRTSFGVLGGPRYP